VRIRARAQAELRNPTWNLLNGTVDFLLCNEGATSFAIVSIAVNGSEAMFAPSGVLLLPGEEVAVTIHYPFKLGYTYSFRLTDSTKTEYGSLRFTAG